MACGCKLLCGGTGELAVQLPSSMGNLNKAEGDTFFNMRILGTRNCLCQTNCTVGNASEAAFNALTKTFSKDAQAYLENTFSKIGYLIDCVANQEKFSFLAMS